MALQDYEKPTLVAEFLPFWDKISMHEQELILRNMQIKSYKKGQKIHGGIDDCIGLLLIKSGRIRIYILSEEGREVTLYRLEKGEVCILSASCALKNITFDVHIDAETDCDIINISSVAISELADHNMYIENFIYKDALARFSDVMWAIEQILFKRLDQRLAMFLLDEATKNNSDVIKLTHEQIARNMGSAREVVSRMLKHFASEGLVDLFRGGVKILDKKRLRLMI